MITSSGLAITEQARSIIRRHVADVEPYMNDLRETDQELAGVAEWLDQLSRLCHLPPESASVELYRQVADYLDRLDHFLRLMNQDVDPAFAHTPIGLVWSHAKTWCDHVQQVYSRFTRDEIWDWIAPAEPDSLEDLGNNVFEAKWAAPIPAMDIEIFCRTEGVKILGEPTEPYDMPDGVGFRFSVTRELDAEMRGASGAA